MKCRLRHVEIHSDFINWCASWDMPDSIFWMSSDSTCFLIPSSGCLLILHVFRTLRLKFKSSSTGIPSHASLDMLTITKTLRSLSVCWCKRGRMNHGWIYCTSAWLQPLVKLSTSLQPLKLAAACKSKHLQRKWQTFNAAWLQPRFGWFSQDLQQLLKIGCIGLSTFQAETSSLH